MLKLEPITISSLKTKIKPSDFESTTTRKAGGLDFTAVGGKRQGREVPQSLRVEPGATSRPGGI
ncbi:MAG: hypothetical protein JRF72_21185 [Deltaproteobacteria bacterium]|jgi:hypothetical protein|nr:hypothetical protein [Deltaproteobacteria bacterium]